MIPRTLMLCLALSNIAFASDSDSFFADPDLISVAISPQGSRVAALHGTAENQYLALVTPQGKRLRSLGQASELARGEGHITGLHWIGERHLAVQLTEIRKGVADLLDTRSYRKLVILQIPEGPEENLDVLGVRTPGWIVDRLEADPYHFLYAKSGPNSRIYRIDTRQLTNPGKRLSKLSRPDGGQFVRENSVAHVKGYAIRWFLSGSGNPEAVLAFTHESKLALFTLEGEDSAEELTSWSSEQFEQLDSDEPPERLLIPIALAPAKDTFYSLDISEDEERSVYKVNYETGDEELVYQTDSGRIVDIIVAADSGELVGLETWESGTFRVVFINREQSGEDDKEPRIFTVIDAPGESPFALVYAESHNEPGTFYSLNLDSGELLYLGGLYPNLRGRLKGQFSRGKVTVEGLEIPFLLNLPQGAGPHPLVVMPHGGPIGIFDSPYFDLTTQYLASRGYAVLRVNFRGSGGYGLEFEEAGRGEWGNLMLKDISEATRAVTSRSDIDSANACVFGMSYGGYAAFMLALRQPEVFHCAVSVAGISDLPLFINSTLLSPAQRRWAVDQLAEPEENYETLKSISPAYLAHELQIPLLILHGEKDEVVDVEQSYRMSAALRRQGVPHEFRALEEGTHDLVTASEQAELLQQVSGFLDRHIGPGS